MGFNINNYMCMRFLTELQFFDHVLLKQII